MAHLDVSGDTLRNALAKRGYERYIAKAKFPLSEKNRRLRLAWALENQNWTLQQWSAIL